MGIRITNRGDWSKTHHFLNRNTKGTRRQILQRYGDMGVAMLSEATPKDTGLTANSWYYQITDTDKGMNLYFCNSNINEGVPIAIILQYGHGTGTGGWVPGTDYINPALTPIFDSLSESLWREVTSD